MPTVTPSSPSRPWLPALVLGLATLAAYSNTFRVPFIYDDVAAVQQSESIRHLWPLSEVLSPSQDGGITTSGRPLVNFTLALNYALSGQNVWSYHAFNLLVHVAAGLTLFALLRRTWRLPFLAARFGAGGDSLALLAALCWLVHPLQTQAVTYVVQRAESLMGLCVLVSLYAFVRSVDAPRPARWQAASVVAALAGVACKEIAALIPLLALLYDRTFIAGSFAGAWRARARLYLALAATWIPLALLLLGTGGDRGGTVSFSNGVPWLPFWLSQGEALFTYLLRALWPHPLVFDYGRDIATSAAGALPYVLTIGALAGATGWLVWRHPRLGFVGACFFLILAPTSLVPSKVQFIVEHRMYLPLAALCAGAAAAVHFALGRHTRLVLGPLALALAALTFARNADYATAEKLWADTVEKSPRNPVALSNLGLSRAAAGDEAGAIALYRRAIASTPQHTEAHFNLGHSLDQLGRTAEAIAAYRDALALAPHTPEIHSNLGNVLTKAGQFAEAREHYAKAIALRPSFAGAHHNLGNLLAAEGRLADATQEFSLAARLDPRFADARFSWGNALAQQGDMAGAAAQFAAAVEIDPNYLQAWVNLGNTFLQREDGRTAIQHYESALRIDPNYGPAHLNLGHAYLMLERWSDAVPHFEAALRVDPKLADAHKGAAFALLNLGRKTEAIAHLEAAQRLAPDDAEVRDELSRQRGY